MLLERLVLACDRRGRIHRTVFGGRRERKGENWGLEKKCAEAKLRQKSFFFSRSMNQARMKGDVGGEGSLQSNYEMVAASKR